MLANAKAVKDSCPQNDISALVMMGRIERELKRTSDFSPRDSKFECSPWGLREAALHATRGESPRSGEGCWNSRRTELIFFIPTSAYGIFRSKWKVSEGMKYCFTPRDFSDLWFPYSGVHT